MFTPRSRKTLMAPQRQDTLIDFEKSFEQMAALTKEFDDWIGKKKRLVLSGKTSHLHQVESIRKQIRLLEEQNDQAQYSIANKKQEIEQNEIALSNLENDMVELEEQCGQLQSHHDSLLRLNKDLKQQHLSLERDLKAQRELQQEQNAKNLPELQAFEKYLALKIIGVQSNQMKFIFTNIDPQNSSRECTFILNLSDSDYQVTQCQPSLDNMLVLVSILNKTRNFSAFLKQVRSSFVKCFSQ
ncbi:hypothetical protein MP228_004888 [Amoeboaphelidium protococcarum]|nr:hypothetical protein MP228_004888 [Amoeboaphelidium protococcarum]